MNRTNLVLVLMGIVLAIGLVLDRTIGHDALFLYALPLPVCFTLLWLSRNVETFSDRVDALDAQHAERPVLQQARS